MIYMEKFTIFMDNNMHNIKLDTITIPVMSDCGILTAASPFIHVDRTADFNVMICVMQGAIYVTEDETDYSIGENEILFLKSGVHHYGKYEIPKGTHWFYAHFYTRESTLNPLSENPPENEYSFHLPKKAVADHRLQDKLANLCEIAHSNDPLLRIKKNSMLYDILTELVINSSHSPETLSDKICAFLESKTSETFTRKLIEDEFFLSYSYMSSVFAKEKGMSPGTWHNKNRIKKACDLLRSSSLSISEVAARLGFDDALYFSRKFRNEIGQSPAKYRLEALSKY